MNMITMLLPLPTPAFIPQELRPAQSGAQIYTWDDKIGKQVKPKTSIDNL